MNWSHPSIALQQINGAARMAALFGNSIAAWAVGSFDLVESGMVSERVLASRNAGKRLRRERILNAAELLVRKSGSTDFSMQDLAREANLSVNTTYNLIGSKATLLYELLNRCIDDAGHFKGDWSRATDAIEAVLEAGDLAVEVYTGDEAFYRALMRYVLGVPDPENRARLASRTYEFWRSAAELLFQNDEVLQDVKLVDLARSLATFFGGCMDLWIHDELSPDEFRAQVRHGLIMRLIAVTKSDNAKRLTHALSFVRPAMLVLTNRLIREGEVLSCGVADNLGTRSKRTEVNRTRLLDAAESLTRELESTDFSMGALARRAGVSPQTTYNLIGSKAELLLNLLKLCFIRVDYGRSQDMESDVGVFAVLNAGDAAIDLYTLDASLYRPLMRYVMGVPDRVSRPQILYLGYSFWRAACETLAAQNLFDDRIAIEDLARDLMVYFTGCIELWVRGEIGTDELRAQVRFGVCLSLMPLAEGHERVRILRDISVARPVIENIIQRDEVLSESNRALSS